MVGKEVAQWWRRGGSVVRNGWLNSWRKDGSMIGEEVSKWLEKRWLNGEERWLNGKE
jgi:hypothetical protein